MESKDYINYQIRKLDSELKDMIKESKEFTTNPILNQNIKFVLDRVQILKEAIDEEREICNYDYYEI